MLEASQYLARSGFVVFDINYRLLVDGGKYPSSVLDVKSASDYLYQNAQRYGIDQNRIGVFGVSSGGYLALMAAFVPNKTLGVNTANRIKCAGAFCPMTDFEQLRESSIVIDYLGCSSEQDPALYKSASPISYARFAVPTLLVHGDLDTIVPVKQTIDLADALTPYTNGTVIRFKRCDHFFSLKDCPQRSQALVQLVSFFKQALAD